MNKLQELMSKCMSVMITINDHRCSYESVKDYLLSRNDNDWNDLPIDMQEEMIKRDSLVDIRFHPRTPVVSMDVIHYDIDMAIQECLDYFI